MSGPLTVLFMDRQPVITACITVVSSKLPVNLILEAGKNTDAERGDLNSRAGVAHLMNFESKKKKNTNTAMFMMFCKNIYH